MENKILIDLSVKYGLNSAELSKLVSVVHQAGVHDTKSRQFHHIANFICESNLIGMPEEKLIEELKRKGLIK